MSQTLDTLLDTAELRMRERGYHAVSFRELADELGIKSASVHYYFRQKEDLGIALVERYSRAFFTALDAEIEGATTGAQRLAALCLIYRKALTTADNLCLCGILGAESGGLPEVLSDRVTAFFRDNISWVVEAQDKSIHATVRRKFATHMIATLQGAVMMSSSLGNPSVFDDAVTDLLARAPS